MFTLVSRRFLALSALSILLGNVQAEEKTLNIYSARHYQTDEALYGGFTKKTGIKINRIEGKEEELLERLKNEGSNSPAAVLVDDDGHVIARDAEFAQQYVEPLGFGNEDHRPQRGAEIEIRVDLEPQQILGEHDPQHIVAVAIDHRKARVGSFDDGGNNPGHRLIDIDDVHQGARNHHVDDPGFRGGKRPLDDGQRVGVPKIFSQNRPSRSGFKVR